MRKVIELPDNFATGESTVQAAVLIGRNGRLLREPLTKTASAASEYCKTVEPKPGMSIVLVLAMGAYEKYGLNANHDGFEDVELEESEGAPARICAPDEYQELFQGDGQEAAGFAPAREYLRGRGLGDEHLWRVAGLGACAWGYYAKRVVVPIFSLAGAWAGFVARSWTKVSEMPYLYPRGMDRRALLYNHAALLKETDEPVLVVEGVFDSLAYWPDAVALLGKPSREQVIALAAAKRPVAVCLDGDAHEEGRQLAMVLELEGQRAGSVKLPPRVDPDEVDKEWLRSEARSAVS